MNICDVGYLVYRMILVNFIFVISLILLSALFSAIETAYTASNPSRIYKSKEEGNKRAKVTMRLMRTKESVISTFLILYSAANTIATTFATRTFISVYGDEIGAIISTVVMTLVIIVFAEVIPKGLAVMKSDKIAIATSGIVQLFMNLFAPVNTLLSYVLRFVCFIFRINLNQKISATQEVKEILEHHHAEGNVYKSDKDMLDGILEIKDMDVSEIMIHRSQIQSISIDLPIREIVDYVLLSEYSCIPMWKKNKDNIIKILDTKKLLKVFKYNEFDISKIRLFDFCEDPWFIPENVLVSTQLHEFRRKKINLALIVDEYGDLQGMITREDIVEEIIGQMHYKIAENIIRKNDRTFLINGSTTIRDLNRELDWNLSDEHSNTIAGFIIHHLGRIPSQGEKFSISNLNVTIRKKDNNQIKIVLIDVIKQFTENEESDEFTRDM